MLCSDNPVNQPSTEISPIRFPLIRKELKYEIGYGLVLCCLCCQFLSLLTDGVILRVCYYFS